jgi:cell division protein FtsN
MSDDSGRPGLKQLSWIAAGVAVLTLVVVAASWLFSPRPTSGDAGIPRGPAVLNEQQVQKETFSPETPGGRPASPASAPATTPAALPETQAQRPVAPAAEVPPPVPAAPPSAGTTAPGPENPAPKEAPAAPKAEPESKGSPSPTHGGFGVQVGAFTEQSKAKEVASRLESLHYTAAILNRDGKFKVVAKGFPDRASAEKAQEALAKAGIRDPFIVPLE